MSQEFEKQSRKIADSSGFPLQILIADIVHKSNKWRVVLEEHPWVSDVTQSEDFIDIIIQGEDKDFQAMVIECKRVRQTKWVFIIPDYSSKKTNNFRIWESRYADSRWQFFGYFDDHADPESYESKFCAIEGQTNGRKTLLERTASALVDSVEALAEQEKSLKRSQHHSFSRVYIPVIVTTAELSVAFVDPPSISLKEGSLSPETVCEPVSYIRFRKSLSGRIVPALHESLEDAHKATARSVFVVTAEGFAEFLDKWKLKG
jgi:hypothetical protein